MISVSALGELLIDFTDAGISANGQKLFERNAGGAPANVLVALERLGHETAFLGKVGDDMHGRFLRDTLTTQNINCDGLIVDPDVFTTLAFVALSPTGERSFSFARKPGADTQLTRDEIRRDIIASSKIFHVGSLSLTDEPARSATIEALETAREAGCIISYDPNYRASLWPSAEVAAEYMRKVIPYANLLKMSAEEVVLLTGLHRPSEGAQALLDAGVDVVCVTMDADGAYVATREGAQLVPSFRVEPIDTTGAGDSFWGGFLSAVLEGGKALADITLQDVCTYARFANAVASLCVRGRGAIPSMPTRAQVDALLASQTKQPKD